jgi:hypothetical protein
MRTDAPRQEACHGAPGRSPVRQIWLLHPRRLAGGRAVEGVRWLRAAVPRRCWRVWRCGRLEPSRRLERPCVPLPRGRCAVVVVSWRRRALALALHPSGSLYQRLPRFAKSSVILAQLLHAARMRASPFRLSGFQFFVSYYFLNRAASSEPPVTSPALYECAPAPASLPPATIRYSSRMGRPSNQHSKISRVPAA